MAVAGWSAVADKACSLRASKSSGRNVQCRAIKFRPCIDIHEGKVKQIVGSSLKDLDKDKSGDLVTNFESEISAGEYANMYREDDLKGGHVIMLNPGTDSRRAAFEALEAYPGGLHVGGGVNADNAAEYIQKGASHVIVTSFVFREGKLDAARLEALTEAVGGPDKVVLDLSCRRRPDGGDAGGYFVVTDRWQRFSDMEISPETLEALSTKCDEFLVHGVDVEGKKMGVDENLIALLGKWSPIPVTYAGGATTFEDLERVRVAGDDRVDITVGSALDIFGGSLPYRAVVDWHKAQQAA